MVLHGGVVVIFPPRGSLVNVWSHLVAITEAAAGIYWTAQHPTVHRIAPRNENPSAPNVSSARIKKPCPTKFLVSLLKWCHAAQIFYKSIVFGVCSF